jgi:hypothetical protein
MSIYRKLLLRLYPFKTLQDDYITRLEGSIGGAGMLHPGNVYAFDYAIKHLPEAAGAILEIGSFAGLSTNVISWLLRKHQRHFIPFFCCDPWKYDGYYDLQRENDKVYLAHFEGCTHVTRQDYTDFIRESFIRNTRLFSAGFLPHSLPMPSDAFFNAWKSAEVLTDVFGAPARLGGPLSFVYVDGDHSYDQARRDVEHALEHLLPGGFLLLDDSANFWKYGSVQLAKEMKRWKGLDLVMKNPNYLFQKGKM